MLFIADLDNKGCGEIFNSLVEWKDSQLVTPTCFSWYVVLVLIKQKIDCLLFIEKVIRHYRLDFALPR